MTEQMIKRVEDILNCFPEVTWDRWSGEQNYFIVFGWIDREDSYKDFVQLTIVRGVLSEISTSSAKYSAAFAQRAGLGHSDCRRVEHDFVGTKHVKLHH